MHAARQADARSAHRGSRHPRGRAALVLTLRAVVAVVAVGLVIWALAGKRDELIGAVESLENLRWAWLALAVGLEAAAIVAYALMERRLFRTGGTTAGTGVLAAVALAGNSLQLAMPGGAAWAYVYAFRQFRGLGADDTLSTWVLVFSTVLSDAALAVVAASGLLIADPGQGPSGAVVVVAGLVALASAFIWLARNPSMLRRVAVMVIGLRQIVLRRPRSEAAVTVDRVWTRLLAVRPGWRDLTIAGWWAFVNWLADFGCFVASIFAVGAGVPWRGVLFAYGMGQLAASLPFTPGGLGVVEGSLTVALVAYGGSTAATVSAVLLYRILSFWLMLPAGGLVMCGLAVARHRDSVVSTRDGLVAEGAAIEAFAGEDGP